MIDSCDAVRRTAQRVALPHDANRGPETAA
jgi:hypothetical protein